MRALRCLALLTMSCTSVAPLWADPVDDARALLRSSPAACRLLDGGSLALRPIEARRDGAGNVFVDFRPSVDGVPCYGELRTVVLPARAVADEELPGMRGLSAAEVSALGELATLETRPLLDAKAARTVAIQDLRTRGEAASVDGPTAVTGPDLVLYRMGGGRHLVWRMVLPGLVQGVPCGVEYAVDARSGGLVDRIRRLSRAQGEGRRLAGDQVVTFPAAEDPSGGLRLRDEALDLNVYDGASDAFSRDDDGRWVDLGPGRKDDQRAEVELYLNMRRVADYFRRVHGFVWYRGVVPVKAVAHYGDDFENAFYSFDEGVFYFGDGTGAPGGYDFFVRALDIVAHEYGHGVDVQTVNLTYSDESGALNEHLSDVMGTWLDDDDWTIGEDIAVGQTGAMRNMEDPTWGQGHLLTPGMTIYQWMDLHEQQGLAYRIYPDRYSLRIICSSWWEDNGGVHLNCNILNRFYVLALTGKGLASPGLGRARMEALYWKLLEDKLLPNRCTFAEFATRLSSAAALLLVDDPGREGLLETLRRAFAAVEL